MINIMEKKEEMVSFIRRNGPSLPVQIAKAVGMEPVLASAVLSEVLGEKRVKMSNLRVGSSFLYLLEGQEERLEEKVDYLKSVEKAAFLKIKKNKVLKDSQEEPATRVALRNIRDFAIPFKFNDEIFWRYAFTPQEEIREMFSPKRVAEVPVVRVVERPVEIEVVEEPVEERKSPSPKTARVKKPVEDVFSSGNEEPKPEFFGEVMNYLKKKGFEFLEEMQTEKKEVVGKVRVSSDLGKIDFLLIAKNKKSVSKDELTAAIQMATYNKMPCLFVLKKSPSKAVIKFVEGNNLIKIGVL
ncbi:MAG: hypothetical protein NUV97_02360 [archaeon]|nr:hypothetical protein [archaeon]MCR4323789.1 hypothetical protein [Nanoarchaeota archaeon]